MRIKGLVILGIVFLSVSFVKAQDLIVMQNGETIKAYQVDVSNNTVYYRLEDLEAAPILRIPKSDVLVIKLQNGKKIVMDSAEIQIVRNNADNEYVPSFPSEPVADPEIIAQVKIGSLIEFYDGTKGIVFYLDGKGHGLAVYLFENNNQLCWQKAFDWFICRDIESIPNVENTNIQIGLGTIYNNAAIDQLGLEELPAINWCRSIGPDWYLPSLGELYELLVVANCSKGSRGPISQAITENGGHPFTYKGSNYYSSSEDDNTKVFSVFSSGAVKSAKKYTPHSCRAVRMF